MNGGVGVSLLVEEWFEVVKWNGDVPELSGDVGAGVSLVESDDFCRAEAIIFAIWRIWSEGSTERSGCNGVRRVDGTAAGLL